MPVVKELCLDPLVKNLEIMGLEKISQTLKKMRIFVTSEMKQQNFGND